MKTIAVIGANGRSGQTFVRAALSAGYHIRGGAHGSSSLFYHDNLEIITIDSTKAKDIAKLIKGCDAVVSLIGHGKNSPDNLLADTMKVLATEMPKAGITKLVSLTGTGVRFDGDHITLGDRLIHVLLKIAMPKILKDGRAHAEVLKNSTLDWTIIRALVLTTGSQTAFTLKTHGPAKFLCPRENIAAGILQILKTTEWNQKAPIVSK